MKNLIPTIICLFLMCYGNLNAQNYSGTTAANNAIKTSNVTTPPTPMSDWEKNWTKESVVAINEIIEEYGYPDELSPNRMYWVIPGEINRTITFTENFLFDLPFETISCNKDSLAVNSRSNL